MAKKAVLVYIDSNVLRLTDQLRGLIPRSRFVESLLKFVLADSYSRNALCQREMALSGIYADIVLRRRALE